MLLGVALQCSSRRRRRTIGAGAEEMHGKFALSWWVASNFGDPTLNTEMGNYIE